MSQGTFFNLLIRLEAFKRIFVCGPKIDFFPRGKPTVLGQNRPNFQIDIFDYLMSLGILACRKTPLTMILKCI